MGKWVLHFPTSGDVWRWQSSKYRIVPHTHLFPLTDLLSFTLTHMDTEWHCLLHLFVSVVVVILFQSISHSLSHARWAFSRTCLPSIFFLSFHFILVTPVGFALPVRNERREKRGKEGRQSRGGKESVWDKRMSEQVMRMKEKRLPKQTLDSAELLFWFSNSWMTSQSSSFYSPSHLFACPCDENHDWTVIVFTISQSETREKMKRTKNECKNETEDYLTE